MSSLRSRKQVVGSLDSQKKAELVQELKKEKLKREQELAAARERRLQRQAAGGKPEVSNQQTSRPLNDLVDRVRRNDSRLISLNFSVGVWWLSGSDIENLSEALAANTKVKEVNFHGNSLGPDGTAILADALMHNRSVTSVNLAANKVTDDGMLPLSQALSSEGCCLQSLNLLSNSISDVGALDLFSALAGNSSLQSLDLSGNGISSIGGTSLAEALTCNTTLSELLLSHNALDTEGVASIREALQGNWALTKLDLSGNHFEQTLAEQVAELLGRNLKLRNLNTLRSGNAAQLNSIAAEVHRPADGEGKPVRFAHEIDIQQTDPRLLAATQTGKELVEMAATAEQTLLLDKAAAVVQVAAAGSCRGLLAMSKLVAEGEAAAEAVGRSGGIPVLVDLIAADVAAEQAEGEGGEDGGEDGGEGGASAGARKRGCENWEALKHAVHSLQGVARSGAEQAEEVVRFMAIGPLLALVELRRLGLRRMLRVLDPAEPLGPLSVVEASWRSVGMSTMAAAVGCVLALATKCPAMAVPAIVAEGGLERFTAVCGGKGAEEGRQEEEVEVTTELRVVALDAIAEIGRYDAAVHRMQAPLEALVEGLGSREKEVASAANRALLRLLDKGALGALEVLLPEETGEGEGRVEVFETLVGWFIAGEGVQAAGERLLSAEEEEDRVSALLLLGMVAPLPEAEEKVTRAGGKGLIYCLVRVLLEDRREECVVNALWVLGAMMEGRAVLQRTLCRHDGGRLLVRLSGGQFGAPESQVAGHAAWLLGVMCEEPAVCEEVVKAGAVEQMVELVNAEPGGEQGRLAGGTLQRLVEGSAEGRRRAKLCGAFEAFVLLSKEGDTEVVAGAVSGISCLTHETIADRLSYREATGQYEAVASPEPPARADTAEAEEAQRSLAARYLNLSLGDDGPAVATKGVAAATVTLLPPEENKPEAPKGVAPPAPAWRSLRRAGRPGCEAGLRWFRGVRWMNWVRGRCRRVLTSASVTAAEQQPKPLPTVTQARRELRAKLLRQRAQR